MRARRAAINLLLNRNSRRRRDYARACPHSLASLCGSATVAAVASASVYANQPRRLLTLFCSLPFARSLSRPFVSLAPSSNSSSRARAFGYSLASVLLASTGWLFARLAHDEFRSDSLLSEPHTFAPTRCSAARMCATIELQWRTVHRDSFLSKEAPAKRWIALKPSKTEMGNASETNRERQSESGGLPWEWHDEKGGEKAEQIIFILLSWFFRNFQFQRSNGTTRVRMRALPSLAHMRADADECVCERATTDKARFLRFSQPERFLLCSANACAQLPAWACWLASSKPNNVSRPGRLIPFRRLQLLLYQNNHKTSTDLALFTDSIFPLGSRLAPPSSNRFNRYD